MLKRTLMTALFLVACLTTLALADGGFYGSITYHDCGYSYGDLVYIQSTGGGTQYTYGIHSGSNPWYNTAYSTPATFPPGYYNIWVVLGPDTDCNMGYVQTVYHGSSDQEVGLRVEKTPPPDSK
jgi:hypothetical protein